MKRHAPEIDAVRAIARKYLRDVLTVERVPKGASTFVYRATTGAGTFYLRFLPEQASFAAEVLAHEMMLAAGLKVPRIIGFEHREAETGLSLMVAEEIPGVSLEEDCPQDTVPEILLAAGRQLALLHTIPVEGFGWIDRSSYTVLKGEKPGFDAYFVEYLEHDLDVLRLYAFTKEQKMQISSLMETAGQLLRVENAVLVHGDFDVSHIFHTAGCYTGIIDFGEIRGNNRVFDLATFVGFYRDRRLYSYLLEGYRDVAPLTPGDLYAVELMALFILLRFLGKKAHTPSGDHWYCQVQAHLRDMSTVK